MIADLKELLSIVLRILELLSAIAWPALLIFACWLVFRYADKIQIWLSIFEGLFANLSSRLEKRSISNNIEGKINSFASSLKTEVEDALPYGIRIEWMKEKDISPQSFLKKDQVIIKMRQHVNQDRNLLVATLQYVSTGLLPKAKNYVSRGIAKSIDFKMVHKILQANKSDRAIEYFFEEVLPLEVKEKPEIFECLEKLHDIDDHGLFTSVLLEELVLLGKRLPPGIEKIRTRAISEVKEFIDFLYQLAITKPGEQSELVFIKKEIKIGIILVAKAQTSLMGAAPYLRRFKKNLAEGCERIYFLSSGVNIDFAKYVCSKVREQYPVEKISEGSCNILDRRGDSTKGYNCLFKPKPE